MFRPIQEAFDAGYLCFIPDQDGKHCLHLLDQKLRDVKLTDRIHYPWSKPVSHEKLAKEDRKQDSLNDAVQ